VDSLETDAGRRRPCGLSLFTAIEEQLGLKLEAQKNLLEAVVPYSAVKVPAEN
jgi:uncharacterized protein (TIGR03435 family)